MMLMSRLKPIEEIISNVKGVQSLLILACNGCEESFGNAEPTRLKSLKERLEEGGTSFVNVLAIDFLCEPILVKHWLKNAECKGEFEATLAVSCGIGVQVVSAVNPNPTHPACDTVSLGGRFGQAWGRETCKECGECILDHTGGLCPLTVCSKGLLNGPCGGSQEGRCEVFPETRACGWLQIYDRLTAFGKTDLLLAEPLLKDYSRKEPPEELVALRNEILENLEEAL